MDITIIENAANTIWGNPNASNDERKDAERVFQELQKVLTIEHLTHIISSTQNQYVLFQVAQYAGEHVLKQWPLLNSEQVESTYQLFLEYVVSNKELSTFAISAFLRSVAMILKRGSLDKKTGSQTKLFEVIRSMLTSNCPRLQSVGCQFISAITEQFSSHWRNSEFSITWDFHIRAKSEFEKTGLRCLLEMSLETLHHLCSSVDILRNEFAHRLCDKFLEVAENIFSWNFSSRLFRRLFALSQTTAAFRPPITWSDLLQNEEFFPLFFKLHSLIRQDEGLCARSMSCLVQLAGLSGECMNEGASVPTEQTFAQRFVNLFTQHLLDLFVDGPLPHEVHSFCLIIQRLVFYRPLSYMMRLPNDNGAGGLRARFFMYCNKYVIYLTEIAIPKSIAQCEHEDKESLAVLFDTWVTMLRGRWRTGYSAHAQQEIDEMFFIGPTWDIVQKFFYCVQSSPLGNRPIAKDEEHDEDSDDRVLFENILTSLGGMIQYNVGRFLENIVGTFRGKVRELQTIMNEPINPQTLTLWQEDMHWFMLIFGYSLVIEEADGTCSLCCEVYDYLDELTQKSAIKFNEETKQMYLCHCMENPFADRPTSSTEIDPFMIFVGELLSWASIQYQLLLTQSTAHLVSPEVIRSTLMCVRKFINTISRIPDSTGDNDPISCPFIDSYGPFNDVLVKFCLDMSFIVLREYRGEVKVCEEAVSFLCCLIETRANALAAEPQLFKHLAELDIASLSSRTILMKALVQIAAAAKEEALQKNMYDLILVPLGERFTSLSSQPSSSENDSLLTDMLQCFDGVALGSDSDSGPVLANVFQELLHPLLKECVPLMKTRAHSAPMVTAILQLLFDTTTRVSIYVEDKGEETVLYESILEISQAYCQGQLHRFVGMTADDEEKSNDLILFLDVLMNVISKDLLADGDSFGSKVAVMAMEVLLGTMNEAMLLIPELAKKFFRFICYLVQFTPDAMKSMSDQFLIGVCGILKTGLSSNYGVEVSSLSLEGIFSVAQYIALDPNSTSVEFKRNMIEMLPTVFELCLEYSCDNSLFTDAANALYGLITIERNYYDAFVTNLLSHKQNESAAHQLKEAFEKLLPSDTDLASRRAKIEFRRRMEVFLGEIQGLLVTN